ncbi:LuxR C-terminal-related transcriptional regulator [Isoptericola sp. NPDC019693]|uniref:LuxR C-terminal-related transcriptional regulator n=1 Tax=Isoptericola sp. NPDC019693 TaxID=3364009 RepID=UPI0037AE0858
MSEASRPALAVRPELSASLLSGKIAPPAPRTGGVSRRALVERAQQAGARVVEVTAPPGYGKSTMLAEWAALEPREVAWVGLDRHDDDPATLLTLLALACSRFSPEVAAVAGEMRGPGPSTLGRSAPLLAAALARTTTPFVLFVDDLQEASSEGCRDVLEVVLGGIPAGSQVVLAGRLSQGDRARRRVEGDLLELDADDLRVDLAGAAALFRDAGVEPGADLAAVVERCEGWPTGIVLCALLVRAGGDASALAGTDRFVADYLYRECLARLPADLQHFLRCTAVLDQLSAGACDAVLDDVGSAALLRRLEDAHLFLVPLDHRRGWFRYHALFREFLLAELERCEQGVAAALHRRAAAWLTAHGLEARAVEHLLAAGDVAEAAELVAGLGLSTYQSGQVTVVTRWLAALGDDAVVASPALTVVATWRALLLGETSEAERWAAALEGVDADALPEPDRTALVSARCQVRAAMCVDGAEAAVACAAFAVDHEPSWSPWYDQALHLLGATRLLVGERDAARVAFRDASAAGTAAGNPDSVLLSEAELAVLDVDDDRWADADAHARAAVRTIEAHHMEGYSTTALALGVSARVALHRGERTVAERFLARAMRARVQCTHVLPFLALRVRLQLGYAYTTLGDRTTAMHLAAEAADLLRRRPRVGLLADEVATFRARLDGLAAAPGTPPLTPAEHRLLPYLQTHLTMAEIGRRLFVSRNTVSTQVGSIYRKLGATTRGAAVERAAELGLLGG